LLIGAGEVIKLQAPGAPIASRNQQHLLIMYPGLLYGKVNFFLRIGIGLVNQRSCLRS
jgi:hypothetical protein